VNPPLVVKVSGKVGDTYGSVAADLAALARTPRRIVLVHGGSASIDEVGRSVGVPPRRVLSASGIEGRFTGAGDIDTLLMASAGLVNKRLVVELRRRGVTALGLSGLDGGLLRGTRKDTLRVTEEGRLRLLRGNHSGNVERVDGRLLCALLELDLVPVVAPLAWSWDERVINVDGDRVAAAIAGSLGAGDLVLLSDVGGLVDGATGEIVRRGHAGELEDRLLPMASGRMRVKLMAAASALAGGVARVAIATAYGSEPVSSALAGGGTHLFAEDRDAG
jgi:[amino group carrier protein]-L-2-aminoadipate 6-kinase